MNINLDNFQIYKRLIYTSDTDKNSLNKIEDIIIQIIKENNQYKIIEEIINIYDISLKNKKYILLFSLAKICENNNISKNVIFEIVIQRLIKNIEELIYFLSYFKKLSWGRNTKKSLEKWLFNFSPRELTNILLEKKNIKSFKISNLIKLIHPSTKNINYADSCEYDELFSYICGKWNSNKFSDLHLYLTDVHIFKNIFINIDTTLELIQKNNFDITFVNYKLLQNYKIWNYYLVNNNISYRFLLKNLLNILHINCISNNLIDIQAIINLLVNQNIIEKENISPIEIFNIIKIIEKNTLKGFNVNIILVCLYDALEISINFINSINKKLVLALDISTDTNIYLNSKYLKNISSKDMTALMTYILNKKENFLHIISSNNLRHLEIPKNTTLNYINHYIQPENLNISSPVDIIKYMISKNIVTDCALLISNNEFMINTIFLDTLLKKYIDNFNPNFKFFVLSFNDNLTKIKDNKYVFHLNKINYDIINNIHNFFLGEI